MMKVTINNNDISYHNVFGEGRKKIMVKLIDLTKEYINKSDRKFKDCVFYIYIMDSYLYEKDDQALPFFCICKPSNRNGILVPDNTFSCHQQNGKCLDWDETKKFVHEKCETKSDNKKNKIFFRGANTGEDKHNLRKLFEMESKKNNIYDITIGSHQIPLYFFCKYKYLLNLPGNQPWSYRFKYLFLMYSIVINIDLRQHYPDSSDTNGRWVNFFDFLFEEDIDYINLVFNWYEDNKIENDKEFDKLLNQINDVYEYFESHPDQAKIMITNATNKGYAITQNIVYEAIYLTINSYASQFEK